MRPTRPGSRRCSRPSAHRAGAERGGGRRGGAVATSASGTANQARPVLVSGATGLVGRRLVASLLRDGIPVLALTRNPDGAACRLGKGCTPVGWDGQKVSPQQLAGSAAVVHLSGEPVFGGPLTARRRHLVASSRIDSTRQLVAAIGELGPEERPRAFVCASAVGFYGSRGEEQLDEEDAPGSGFLASLCQAWEAAASGAEGHGVRRVSLRFGIVLSGQGGALQAMVRPFRLGLGARLGNGRQWFPWVHLDDAVGLCRLALSDESLHGPMNVVAPAPVRNAEFTRAIARALGRPAFLWIPGAPLRLVLGELSEELLGSRRVEARAAAERGYAFAFPEIGPALERELGRGSRG